MMGVQIVLVVLILCAVTLGAQGGKYVKRLAFLFRFINRSDDKHIKYAD